MVTFLVECAIRSALMATGTAVVLWILRIKTPAVQHAAWTAVVLTMLTLPMWMAGGLKVSLPVLRPMSATVGVATANAERIAPGTSVAPARQTTSSTTAADPDSARRATWQNAFVGAYVVGLFVLLARLLIGTVQANRLRRRARMDLGRLTSGRCATPITVGWFRPALILPQAWRQWPAAKLDAVLTHEAEHARRHDPLVQWLALLNRAMFWFHPLSWWLERRLSVLAEEACDAAVLAAGHSPQDYSDYLLDLARSLTREGRRVNVVGLAMPGSGLTERMHHILDAASPQRTSRMRVIGTLMLCAASIVVGAAGTLTATRSSQDAKPPQTFQVVSVKPCDSIPVVPGGRIGGAGHLDSSPGTMNVTCMTVVEMARRAYVQYGDPPPLNTAGLSDADLIKGGPAWARTDRYSIEAKAGGTASLTTMAGAMLRAVLADRFQLKIRQDLKDVPALALTVAAGGLKLKPADPGSCTPSDPNSPGGPRTMGHDGLVRAVGSDKPLCAGGIGRHGANATYTVTGQSLDRVAKTLGSLVLTRPVVDETGITDLFSFIVEFAPDETMRPIPGPPGEAAAVPDGPSLFAVFEKQLGLKLVPTKAQQGTLVIDHLERPAPNLVMTGGLR